MLKSELIKMLQEHPSEDLEVVYMEWDKNEGDWLQEVEGIKVTDCGKLLLI
jgi:hypothetical protein